MPEINQQQAFFFMPDISGFTKFVNETEIEHSTHLIKELLEIIVNTNNLNLEIQEIEGDAVFFFRLGRTPSLGNIIQQAKAIFERFHQHLIVFQNKDMCQCGACRSANQLTIKFFIHTGPVSSFHIGNHFKLIGKDIILLHRLSKNNVPLNEYLLFTEPFFGMLESKNISTIMESEEFDNIVVRYQYIPIHHWLQEINIPE